MEKPQLSATGIINAIRAKSAIGSMRWEKISTMVCKGVDFNVNFVRLNRTMPVEALVKMIKGKPNDSLLYSSDLQNRLLTLQNALSSSGFHSGTLNAEILSKPINIIEISGASEDIKKLGRIFVLATTQDDLFDFLQKIIVDIEKVVIGIRDKNMKKQASAQKAFDKRATALAGTQITVLPKEVSVYEESQVTGAKRIAPDRVAHQQLTPEAGIRALISSQADRVNKIAQSYFNYSQQFHLMIGNYGDSMPLKTSANISRLPNLEKDHAIYHDIKKQVNYSGNSLSGLSDYLKQRGEELKWSQEKENAYSEKVVGVYIDAVKKDISKGYKYPVEVLQYDKSFITAVSSRERYEKGLNTSFSADDARIVFDDADTIGAGMKRQDGTEIPQHQKDEIRLGVKDFSEVLGLDMKKIAQNDRWVYVHLNGKNPFLKSGVAGLYRKDVTNHSISISVGGIEKIYKVENGKRVAVDINTVMAHELGHAIDYKTNKNLFSYAFIRELGKLYNPCPDWFHELRQYYDDPREIVARVIEQYVSVAKGHTEYYARPAYWNKDVFESLIAPEVPKAIKTYLSEYQI